MITIPKTPIPIVLKQYSIIDPEQFMQNISLANYHDRTANYGVGHAMCHYREEIRVASRAQSTTETLYLGGVYNMMHVLKDRGDAPLNKLQRTMLLASFPNGAKKVLSALETPSAVINWLHDKPEEVFSAMGMELPTMPRPVRVSRAVYCGMSEKEANIFADDGTIPERLTAHLVKKGEEPVSVPAQPTADITAPSSPTIDLSAIPIADPVWHTATLTSRIHYATT